MTVTKTVDLSGTSDTSIEAAIDEAIARAGLTVEDIEEFEISRITGTVKDGGVDAYRVWIKVTFVVKERIHE
jgi:dodecin